MEILAARGLRASSLTFQQGTDRTTLAVVAKTTFHLATGKVRLAEPDQQEPITEDDSHWDDDPGRSLRFASDLVPCKARVDVVLDACAQAPADGRPSVVMRLLVGKSDRPLLDKMLVVSPPQFLMPNGAVQRDAWPQSLSIRYERSAGGRGTANPAGVDPNGPRDTKGRLARPSVEAFPAKPACEPIGFGPIAPMWPTRLSKIAASVQGFSGHNWQGKPFPPDFRWSYFNVAPEDQQIDTLLRGNERIVLENIVTNTPVFETQLVSYRPQGYVRRSNDAMEALHWTCDTLWIDATRMRLFVIWRAHVALSSATETGQVAIALAEPAETLSFAEVASLANFGATEDVAATLVLPKTAKQKGTLSGRDTDNPLTVDAKTGSPRPEETQPLPHELLANMAMANLKETLVGAPVISPSISVLPFVKSAAPPPVAPPIRASSPGEPIAPAKVESPWAIGTAATLPQRPALATHEGRPAESIHLGVVSASNAAAGAAEKGPAKEKAVEVVAKNEPKGKEKPKEIVELLWYDPAALPRIRRHLAWKKIIAELKPRPSDDDFDGGLPPEQMKAAKDKRDVLGVLARGEVMDLEGIRRAMEMAVLEDGSFVPPYVLTQGTLEFQFDEVETLKAMLLVVAPFVPGDKKLKETVDLINEVMKTPGIERAKRVAEGLTKRLKEAFYQQNRGVGVGYLDEEVGVILVEGRCYRRISSSRSPQIASTFKVDGNHASIILCNDSSIHAAADEPTIELRIITECNGVEGKKIILKPVAIAQRVWI